MLDPILSPAFSYLDGASGETWTHERYVEDLRSHPAPTLDIDQLSIHIEGDTAVVSARASSKPGQYNRYIDTYQRHDQGWLCVHACVWPLNENR